MFLSYQPRRLVEVFAVLPAFTVGIKLALVTGALARPLSDLRNDKVDYTVDCTATCSVDRTCSQRNDTVDYTVDYTVAPAVD